MSQADVSLYDFLFSSGYCLPCILVCSALCVPVVSLFPNASVDQKRETLLRAVSHTGTSVSPGSPLSPALPALVWTGCFLASSCSVLVLGLLLTILLGHLLTSLVLSHLFPGCRFSLVCGLLSLFGQSISSRSFLAKNVHESSGCVFFSFFPI